MSRWLLTLACVVLAACGGDTPTGDTKRVTASLTLMSGDIQEGVVGQELPQPIVVRAVDAQGRPVAGQLINFRVTAGGGTVFSGSSITNADGVAQERWTLGPVAADTQKVEARAVNPETGAPIVFATFRAVGRPAAAATLTVVSGSGQSGPVGAPLTDSLVVEARDAFNNRVPGASIAWAVTSGGGTVSAASTTTDAQGRAWVRWTLGMRLDTTHVVTATRSGIPAATFTATPTLPATAVIEVAEGDAQTDTVGRRLPIALGARVRLADGRPVQGVAVAWAVEGSAGSLAPLTATTNEQGIARAQWTLGTVTGTQYARATAAGLASVARFSATALPGAIASFTIVGGNGQLGEPGATLANPLVVRASDQYGNALAGRTVQWAVTSGGGSLSQTDTVTDASGRASTVWTLGATTGEQTVVASTMGAASLTFTATATSGTGSYTFVRVAESLTTGTRLNDVWASGTSDVYVVGDTGLVLHFDGSTWSRVTGVSDYGLLTVSGSSPSHVIVGGYGGRSVRFDGTSWALVPNPSGYSGSFNEVHVLSPSFALAAMGGSSMEQNVLVYDGSGWTRHPEFIWYGSTAHPKLCPIFEHAWAVSPSTYWVVSTCYPTLVKWDGSTWTKEGDAFTLWGVSESDRFIATSYGVYRHVGSSSSLSLAKMVNDLHGSSSTNVFATEWPLRSPGATQLHHFDGTQWTVAHDFAPAHATDVWAVSSREVYVLTSNGQIWRGRR